MRSRKYLSLQCAVSALLLADIGSLPSPSMRGTGCMRRPWIVRSREMTAHCRTALLRPTSRTPRSLTYSERQAERLFGRHVRHVLLLHANALNARSFDALAG